MENKEIYNDRIKFNKACSTIEKILEYSLYFPEIEPIDSECEDDWVPLALLKCHQNCHKNLFEKIEYNFFGITISNGSDDILNSICTSSINQVVYDKAYAESAKSLTFFKSDFFAKTLLSHCLIAAYDTTVRLFPFKQITSFGLNKIKNTGLDKLLCDYLGQDKYYDINYSIKTADVLHAVKANRKNITPSEATRLTNKINTHSQSILNLKGFTKFFNADQIDNSIEFCYADIVYLVCGINARTFTMFSNMCQTECKTEEGRALTNWKCFCKIYEELYNKTRSKDSWFDDTDRLYFYYKLENIFGLDLANTIFHAIQSLNKENKSYPDGANEYKVLAEISRFPNVFSRNLYLEYAFEHIRYERSAHNSCFLKPSPAEAWGTSIIPSQFNFTEWMFVFEKFCKLFNKLIFPVEEWYFFLILKKTVDEYYNAESDEKIIKLNRLLKEYINQNAVHIEQPLSNYFQEFPTPKIYEYSQEAPNIAMLLSLFDKAKSKKDFPMSILRKKDLMPEKEEGMSNSSLHDICYNVLLQTYISFITDY